MEEAVADESTDNIKPELLGKIQAMIGHLNVTKIYFIDDALNQDNSKDKFKGIVDNVMKAGKLEELKAINLTGINFNSEEAVLLDHIDEVWDTIKPKKQLKYFEKVYAIDGTPEAIKDLDVTNNLQEFFNDGQIEFLKPEEWDAKNAEILASVGENERVVVIFDQDLRLAPGRFQNGAVKGENLILELKEKNLADKVIVALLTHTITSCETELTERVTICGRVNNLQHEDFFVLAKIRLEKHALFADGIKKLLLNTFCEKVKNKTISILQEAQAKTIEAIKQFDTYSFDHTVFKSSHIEGAWEPETLLRITDIIFKDEVRKIMKDRGYVSAMNPTICSAQDISKIEFRLDDSIQPYGDRFKLRHQEIYEASDIINSLRKPIDNGDIFTITSGELAGRKFILVGQECDLMVRGETGKRGGRIATFLEIKTLTEKQLLKEMVDKYQSEIDNERFLNHFFADKFKLEYFEEGTNKVGLVLFGRQIVVDLNVLDLVVFNEAGEAKLDLANPTYNEKFHNLAWRNRFNLIKEEFEGHRVSIEALSNGIAAVPAGELKTQMLTKFSHLFSYIVKAGILVNYNTNVFEFGIKRVGRLRFPKSKFLLDRYYQHLSRFAELHDFAD